MSETAGTDLELARAVLKSEASAIAGLIKLLSGELGEGVRRAVRRICALQGGGRLVVSGMGKAGIVAQKIAATFASLGTPALFVHPAEAVHGDLGMITGEDAVLVLSNSGRTDEVVRLLPFLKRRGAAVLAMTGDPGSPLAEQADVVLCIGKIEEACPLGLAPSASTTAMLALGDALALCSAQAKGFDMAQYAAHHPGGELGRKLLRVREVMRAGERAPLVRPETSVEEAVSAVTRARAGSALVAEADGTFRGIMTDGDFRRAWSRFPDLRTRPVAEIMTPVARCTVAEPDWLVSKAQRIMAERHFDDLPVVEPKSGRVVGLLDIQDIVHRGDFRPDG